MYLYKIFSTGTNAVGYGTLPQCLLSQREEKGLDNRESGCSGP